MSFIDNSLTVENKHTHSKRSDIKRLPEYFDRYINLVDDIPLLKALNDYGWPLLSSEMENLVALGDKVYAENKWTIKDILQHIIDGERIFSYRALSFARNDRTHLPGFDENAYADETNTDDRSLTELTNEFINVRKSTIDLFNSFSDDQLQRTGISNNREISVLALGFTITGHLIHHMNVIKVKYYPLI